MNILKFIKNQPIWLRYGVITFLFLWLNYSIIFLSLAFGVVLIAMPSLIIVWITSMVAAIASVPFLPESLWKTLATTGMFMTGPSIYGLIYSSIFWSLVSS